MQCESELKNILVNGITLETNEEKAKPFAKAFSDISSNNFASALYFCSPIIFHVSVICWGATNVLQMKDLYSLCLHVHVGVF